MRPETGKAVLAASPQLQGDPSLTSLVGRIAASRGLTTTPVADTAADMVGPAPAPPAPTARLVVRAPERLVTPPPPGRSLPVDERTGLAGELALLAAHGGAGVTSLLRAGLDSVAVDAGGAWPAVGLVVVVTRTNTSGVEWARDLARQHANGLHEVQLLGLVAVADAPGRLPHRIQELLELVSGAFTRTWQLPWLEEWRLASATEPLPAHPDVQHLAAELARTPQLSHPHLSRTTRTTRPRGDLL